jgi:hypothetical protein
MTQRVLDTADIDRYLGKPIDCSTIREPLANNDIRRWVHAMHYPNLLQTDYLAGWAGEHGTVVHSVANYRGPALSGDITIQTAEVVGKFVDGEGRHLVQVKHRMANQKDTILCTGTAEIQLPNT